MSSENFVARQYKRAADEADDLQEREQYLKDIGVDHEENDYVIPEKVPYSNPLEKKLNESLAISYINNQGRYDLDIRKSHVYYDKDGDVLFLLSNELKGEGVTKELCEKAGVYYHSIGVK